MIPLMQRELDTFKDTIWNSHRVRQQKDAVLPAGIPDHIYSFPEEYGLEECGNLWLAIDDCVNNVLVAKEKLLNYSLE